MQNQILESIRIHGAQAVYDAANRHMTDGQALASVGLMPTTMGDVFAIHSAAYAQLGDAAKVIDYAQAQAALATLGQVTIKSIMPVRAYGAGNNGNWVARLRLSNCRELFAGLGAGYSLAQAQSLITNNRERVGGSLINGELYVELPDGITVKA